MRNGKQLGRALSRPEDACSRRANTNHHSQKRASKQEVEGKRANEKKHSPLVEGELVNVALARCGSAAADGASGAARRTASHA